MQTNLCFYYVFSWIMGKYLVISIAREIMLVTPSLFKASSNFYYYILHYTAKKSLNQQILVFITFLHLIGLFLPALYEHSELY